MAGDIDNDDYVANLLKADAQKTAKQYKMVGMDAFLPSRTRSSAPKPNKRFLAHIIRETDSHNTALLAKEAEESRARLRRLHPTERANERAKQRAKERDKRLTPPELTDEEQYDRKRKRSRYDEEPEERSTRHRIKSNSDTRSGWDKHKESDRSRHKSRYDDSEEESRWDKSKASKHERSSGRRDHHRHEDNEDENARRRYRNLIPIRDKGRQREEAGSRSRHKSRREQEARRENNSQSVSRSPSPRRHRTTGSHYKSRREKEARGEKESQSTYRSPSPRRHRTSRSHHASGSRSRSPKRRRTSRTRHGSSSRNRSRERESQLENPSPTQDDDSDPLEEIVGPLPPPVAPPVRSRGRGAHKANSMTMDARFSSTYDPTTDVKVNSDVEDDWGDALEALQDRQRWKQQGAERLKAAGFTDEQVKKWEKGGEKTEEDVRWAAKGEGREWDRGKVLDEEGDITLKPEWGRLT